MRDIIGEAGLNFTKKPMPWLAYDKYGWPTS
jgi:hypothetical protein